MIGIEGHKKKLTLFSVFFTFFIDNLCWAIVFPIFAPYFLDGGNRLFSAEVSEAARTTVLGIFLMAFSLGQFLGAPVIGEYADRHGRKKALLLGVFFTLVGLALSAWSMQIHSLVLLFIGRLITGIFASSTSICLACVSDLSENEKAKVKNFGYMSVIAGLSFVLGAFLGGKLSDPTIDPMFRPNFPLWLAAGMTLANLMFVWLGFRETWPVDPSVKFDLLESFRNIKRALQTEKIKRTYTVYFLFLFAWTALFQFSPVLMVAKYYYTNSDIGDLALYMGICWAIGSGYLNKWLIRLFDPLRVLEFCLVGFTVLCGLMVVPMHIYGVLGILGLCVVLGGLAWPLCTGMISNLVPRHFQGKILGVSQSIQSLAMAIAPVISGMAYTVSMGLPFLIGAAASLLAGVIYFTLKDR